LSGTGAAPPRARHRHGVANRKSDCGSPRRQNRCYQPVGPGICIFFWPTDCGNEYCKLSTICEVRSLGQIALQILLLNSYFANRKSKLVNHSEKVPTNALRLSCSSQPTPK